jgi:hypothetical protein
MANDYNSTMAIMNYAFKIVSSVPVVGTIFESQRSHVHEILAKLHWESPTEYIRYCGLFPFAYTKILLLLCTLLE